MSFQMSCKYCGKIHQSEMPIIKNDGVLEFTCTSCDSILFYLYGSEHKFTKLIREINEDDNK